MATTIPAIVDVNVVSPNPLPISGTVSVSGGGGLSIVGSGTLALGNSTAVPAGLICRITVSPGSSGSFTIGGLSGSINPAPGTIFEVIGPATIIAPLTANLNYVYLG
jgi:hypothetical protein